MFCFYAWILCPCFTEVTFHSDNGSCMYYVCILSLIIYAHVCNQSNDMLDRYYRLKLSNVWLQIVWAIWSVLKPSPTNIMDFTIFLPTSRHIVLYLILCFSLTAATTPLTTCETIQVDRQLKYITSQLLWTLQCFSSSLQEVEINFQTQQNLKIKLHLTLISGKKDSSLFMNNSTYVIHGSDGTVTCLDSMGSVEFDDHHITLVMNKKWRDNVILIGYQGRSRAPFH